MKIFTLFVEVLLVATWITTTRADISLTLKNKQYLPPPIQEVPITDDFYTGTRENKQQQQPEQQTFKESDYGNSRYQIYEVHNPYKTSSKEKSESVSNEKKVSSSTVEEVRIEHINAPEDFPLDDPNLDASYIGLADEGDSKQDTSIIVKHEYKSTEGSTKNIPIPFPSNCRHNFPERLTKQHVQQSVGENSEYQSQKYQALSREPQPNSLTTRTEIYKSSQKLGHKKESLPPIPTKSVDGVSVAQEISNKSFKGAGSQYNGLNSAQSFAQNTPFEGHDYLPPRQHHEHQHNLAQTTQFKGPDYLPPHQHQQQSQGPLHSQQNSGQNILFKGPDYLPPYQHQQHQQQSQGPLLSQQNSAQNIPFKGPNYLPPHQHQKHPQNALHLQQSLGQNPPFQARTTQFKAPDYLPPHQNQQQSQGPLHSQQNSAQNIPFKGPEYLPPHRHHQQQQRPSEIQSQQNFAGNEPFKGPDYLPPHQVQQIATQGQQQQHYSPNTPFKGPDYLPPHQQPQSLVNLQHQQQQNQVFRASQPEYLPPQSRRQAEVQQAFKGPDYLPPYQEGRSNNNDAPFKGPDYLPPQPQQQTEFQQHRKNAFKGPDYLPPHQEGSSNNIAFKGPDYLPPVHQQGNQQQQIPSQQLQVPQQLIASLPLGYDFEKPANAEQAIAELHTLPEEQSQPQYKKVNVQSQLPVPGRQQSVDIIYGSPKQTIAPQNSGTYQAPGYLPPDYIAKKPQNAENAIRQLHSQDIPASLRQPFKAPDYLPPAKQIQSQGQEGSKTAFPVQNSHFPHGYGFVKPANAEQAINTLHGQQNSDQHIQLNQQGQISKAGQSYGNQVTHTYQQSNNPEQIFQQFVQPAQQQFKGPEYLPPVAGVQLFKGHDYLPPTTTTNQALKSTTGSETTQVFKGPDYLPPVATESHIFKGPDYLPPKVSGQTIARVNNKQFSQVFKGPEYLPPVANVEPIRQHQFKGPDYLPPITSTITYSLQSAVMYPLSSYMNYVKPSDRYANERKPFAEYGLPPVTNTPVSRNIEVSPMYREPASRPQYYAPAMSYTTYKAKSQYKINSGLNQQARETLETFMPQEIMQQVSNALHTQSKQITTTAVQTAAKVNNPVTSKTRTVQIVNSNAIKTLKVLETLDQTGVKTIKILGPSLQQPMGEHRVIKVVGSGNEKNVYTVKIFNDHQDVTTSDAQQSPTNAYLPGRRKRNSSKEMKV